MEAGDRESYRAAVGAGRAEAPLTQKMNKARGVLNPHVLASEQEVTHSMTPRLNEGSDTEK